MLLPPVAGEESGIVRLEKAACMFTGLVLLPSVSADVCLEIAVLTRRVCATFELALVWP